MFFLFRAKFEKMETIELKLQQPHFADVASGDKVIDGRICFPHFRNYLKPGCTIKFVFRGKFVLKELVSFQEYVGFRAMLKNEGTGKVLPHAKDLHEGVRMYHKLRANNEGYEELAKQFGVVALRLGDVTCAPYRPLTQGEARVLGTILKTTTGVQWLTKIGAGTFATVYNFKRVRVQELLTRMQISLTDKPRLEKTLCNTAVRILKARLSKTVRTYEIRATEQALQLPRHPNILWEQKLVAGITTSRLYHESLKKFIASQLQMCPTQRDALQCVLSALVNAVGHMHKYRLGHFDIKPSNVLIKWPVLRGQFTHAEVVLADFGLSRQLGENGWYTTHSLTHSFSQRHSSLTHSLTQSTSHSLRL